MGQAPRERASSRYTAVACLNRSAWCSPGQREAWGKTARESGNRNRDGVMMSLAMLGARRTGPKETGQDVKLVAHPYNTIDEKMARETCTAHTCVGLEADGVVRHSQPCQVSRWMAEALLPALGRVAGARAQPQTSFLPMAHHRLCNKQFLRATTPTPSRVSLSSHPSTKTSRVSTAPDTLFNQPRPGPVIACLGRYLP